MFSVGLWDLANLQHTSSPDSHMRGFATGGWRANGAQLYNHRPGPGGGRTERAWELEIRGCLSVTLHRGMWGDELAEKRRPRTRRIISHMLWQNAWENGQPAP